MAVATADLDALLQARALIADPARWTRSAPARRLRPARGGGKNRHEAHWLPTHATDRRAGRWCAAGALCVVSGKRSGPPGIRFLEEAAQRLFGTSIGRANDDRRFMHADLLRCYDAAIAAASAEPASRRATG